MLSRISLMVAVCLSIFASNAVAQQRVFTPQEQELFTLQAQTQELKRKIQELELARARRELEDQEKLSRADALLYQHYKDSVEESRIFFDGKTIEEILQEVLPKGHLAAPEQVALLVKGYAAFKYKYGSRAHAIIQETVTNVDHWAQLRTTADNLIAHIEKSIFDKDTGIVHAAENYAKAVADERAYELMSKLSEQQRMELAMCRLLNQLSPACKPSARPFGSVRRRHSKMTIRDLLL